MAKATDFAPKDTQKVVPYLVVNGAEKALEWYRNALGATEVYKAGGPGEKVMHAEITIADTVIYLCDEFPEMGAKGPLSIGGTPVTFHCYVPDTDAAYARAVAAGAKGIRPPEDQFWGQRYSLLQDPFGHMWSFATKIEDLTPQEVEERGKKMMAANKS